MVLWKEDKIAERVSHICNSLRPGETRMWSSRSKYIDTPTTCNLCDGRVEGPKGSHGHILDFKHKWTIEDIKNTICS